MSRMPLSQVAGVNALHAHRRLAVAKAEVYGCCGETEYLTRSTGRCFLCGKCPNRMQELDAERVAKTVFRVYADGWESEASFPLNGTPITREVA